MNFLDGIEKEGIEKARGQRKQYKLSEFVFDARGAVFWNIVTMTQHSAEAVNALVPRDEWETELVPGRNGAMREIVIKPSSSIARIERDTVVESVAWWPGMPRIIKDILVTDDGGRPLAGVRTLNVYVEPRHHAKGNPAMAGLWVEHIKKLWPEDAELLLDFFAHLVQRQHEKANYGLVLIGAQGIGKDMALAPLRMAVGTHNCAEISPDAVVSNFNGWIKSILVVVNEARPTDSDFRSTDFYERLKPMMAAPPDWLLCNAKYERQVHVRNLMRVIITTNDPLALYVPEDDRRLYFAQSRLPPGWADSGYFCRLADFYESGGHDHAYAFLKARDISNFDPKRRPAPNAAHAAAAVSWNQPIHDPLSDVLDDLGWPPLFFGKELLFSEVDAFDSREEVMALLKSSRKLAVRMSKLGYEQRKSPSVDGWRFRKGDKRSKFRVAFVKRDFVGDFERAIERRGREIVECGKAARPSVLPFPGGES